MCHLPVWVNLVSRLILYIPQGIVFHYWIGKLCLTQNFGMFEEILNLTFFIYMKFCCNDFYQTQKTKDSNTIYWSVSHKAYSEIIAQPILMNHGHVLMVELLKNGIYISFCWNMKAYLSKRCVKLHFKENWSSVVNLKIPK